MHTSPAHIRRSASLLRHPWDMQNAQDRTKCPRQHCSHVSNAHICTLARSAPCTTAGEFDHRACKGGAALPRALPRHSVSPPRSPGQAFEIVIRNLRSTNNAVQMRCLDSHVQGKSRAAGCPFNSIFDPSCPPEPALWRGRRDKRITLVS
jgi:hypothetical protein